MALRSAAPIGQPCWIDLLTSAPDRARAFYGELFGWTSGEASPEFGGYFMLLRDGVPVAGVVANTSRGVTLDRWRVHVAVNDVEVTLAKAVACGARVALPPATIADLGVTAVLADRTDAHVGLWSANSFHGFSAIDELNAPRWFELHTHGYDQAIEFYREVFDWDLRPRVDTPSLHYATANDGEVAFASVLDATGHVRRSDPSAWVTTFGVNDVDRALHAVTSHGGSVLRPAAISVFGRAATVRDPSGVVFQVAE